MTQTLSVIAVAGAWVAGIGVILAVLCFSYAVLNPRLLRIGIAWLVAADAGTIAMLAALLGLIPGNQVALWVSCILGIIVLAAITGGAFYIAREAARKDSKANAVIDTVRSRIEF